eukprot:scaffold208110_cov34-Prasinocladus_malaysianus.AAC.1
MLTEQQLKDEVVALEKQGHRRLLVLTGEHPKYTFDEFLKVGKSPNFFVSLRSIIYLFNDGRNVHPLPRDIPPAHICRLLTQDRAMRAGLDDVGIGTLFGLYDYRFEVMAMLMHANHLEAEYGAGPHTISVPRLRAADGSEVSVKPPYEVDDANFK